MEQDKIARMEKRESFRHKNETVKRDCENWQKILKIVKDERKISNLNHNTKKSNCFCNIL